MTSRAQIVTWATDQVGTVHATGYDGPNPYSANLGRPVEAWCGDFVTDGFLTCRVPLPVMQAGCRTGFAYVPAALKVASEHGRLVRSWEALPGDLALFDWNGDGVPDHVEIVNVWTGGTLYTIGGNSGAYAAINDDPINGGVNAHRWTAPTGIGNRQILTVIDAASLVLFTTVPPTVTLSRLLMLKSPMMTGADVTAVQEALNKAGFRVTVDGVYGPLTEQAVIAFQRSRHLTVDGVVGPQTRAAGL